MYLRCHTAQRYFLFADFCRLPHAFDAAAPVR
jgi:hypothetical protein